METVIFPSGLKDRGTTSADDYLLTGRHDTGEAFRCAVSDVAAFTFIVNSSAALAAWTDNAAGNDYSHVLIKKGTWTSSKGVNLTTTGTKVVVGEAGSLLSFQNAIYICGLQYTTMPSTGDFRMLGVNVQVMSTGSAAIGFSYCPNLLMCTAKADSYGSADYSAAFQYCRNLHGCTGAGGGAKLSSYGFHSCRNLHGCTGTGTNSDGDGYGFYSCRGMSLCQPGSTDSTTATYQSCYASISGTGAAPSDTALGGWNMGGAGAAILPMAQGGTGAATAADARAALGITDDWEAPEWEAYTPP